MAEHGAEPTWLWCWRHPRAVAAAGRCIGSTDLPVTARQAKRLAHRVRAVARRHALPREVWVSPLARSRAVGRWLRRWGWQVHVDARLAEVDFGAWEGRAWADIPWAEVEAWRADLLHHAPGGGETLAHLAQRAHAFAAEARRARAPRLVVGHAGWMGALGRVPAGCTRRHVDVWPPAAAHGALRCWPPRSEDA